MTEDAKRNMTDAELLLEYSNELDTFSPITVASLIDGHRELVKIAVLYHTELANERKKAYEAALKHTDEWALANNWISVEKLRSMTVAQLAQLIGAEE